MADVEVLEIKACKSENSEAQKKLEHTTEEINKKIQEITDKLVKEFEQQLDDKEGYQYVIVKNKILAVTDNYFTLKRMYYQGANKSREHITFISGRFPAFLLCNKTPFFRAGV